MRYIGFVKALILSLCVVLVFGRCSEEQEYAEVGFSALNISWAEDDSLGNVSLKLTGADPVLLPVVVDVEFEPVDVNGNLDEIEYDKITGWEVYPDSVTKIPFLIKDNDVLNEKPFRFKVKLIAASDAALGSINSCTVTITDDEKAPRINTGSYDLKYDVEGLNALRDGAGEFELKLAKTGKYEYVAYNWFGMQRPRLVGVFDPEAKTLTFDGTDYDGPVFKEDDSKVATDDDEESFNAFAQAYYSWNTEMTEAMVFMGSGADGKEPIVFTTDELVVNESGDITGLAAGVKCAYIICKYEAKAGEPGVIGEQIAIYDQMSDPEIEYNDPDETKAAGYRAYEPSFVSPLFAPVARLIEVAEE